MPINQSVTKDEVTALTDASIKVATILEDIHRQLTLLGKLDDIDEQVRHVLVRRIVEEAIIDKGLDVTNKESKISKEIEAIQELTKEVIALTKELMSSQKKIVWAILFAVTILGGIKTVSEFYYARTVSAKSVTIQKDEQTNELYVVDPISGETFIVKKK